jgi:hypothetical protein
MWLRIRDLGGVPRNRQGNIGLRFYEAQLGKPHLIKDSDALNFLISQLVTYSFSTILQNVKN